MNVAEPEKKVCESCKNEFDCGASVGKCWCFDVALSQEILAQLKNDFRNCLCNNCLHELKITEQNK